LVELFVTTLGWHGSISATRFTQRVAGLAGGCISQPALKSKEARRIREKEHQIREGLVDARLYQVKNPRAYKAPVENLTCHDCITHASMSIPEAPSPEALRSKAQVARPSPRLAPVSFMTLNRGSGDKH
jgi:hypothetical protein